MDCKITKTKNGFPISWKAGILEKEILDKIAVKIRDQLHGHILLLNTTWMHDTDIDSYIKNSNFNTIVAVNLVDPAIPNILSTIRNSGSPYTIIGNCSEYRLDFWALACHDNFRTYTDEQLILSDNARRYLCLNRKPHGHRIFLARVLHDKMPDFGHISLGTPNDPIRLDERFTEDQGISDEYQALSGQPQAVDHSIKNDIYSLGDLRYWNDALLNIVTETEFWNPVESDFFISEKTWKPIIGLRPFFVYGQPKLLNYLESQGFDTFRDLINYPGKTRSHLIMQSYVDSALKTIAEIDDTKAIFNELLPRLKKNKARFKEYVHEQQAKLSNLRFDEILNV